MVRHYTVHHYTVHHYTQRTMNGRIIQRVQVLAALQHANRDVEAEPADAKARAAGARMAARLRAAELRHAGTQRVGCCGQFAMLLVGLRCAVQPFQFLLCM